MIKKIMQRVRTRADFFSGKRITVWTKRYCEFQFVIVDGVVKSPIYCVVAIFHVLDIPYV
jgi:hypothetical protein